MKEMIETNWALFKKFLQDPESTQLLVDANGDRIHRLVEQDEQACEAIFGSGFSSGMSVLMDALQHAHDMAHVEAAMRDIPDKKRPRA